MQIFICKECGYAKTLYSGVPSFCECCEKYFTMRRGTHEEYNAAETNDGKIQEVNQI